MLLSVVGLVHEVEATRSRLHRAECVRRSHGTEVEERILDGHHILHARECLGQGGVPVALVAVVRGRRLPRPGGVGQNMLGVRGWRPGVVHVARQLLLLVQPAHALQRVAAQVARVDVNRLVGQHPAHRLSQRGVVGTVGRVPHADARVVCLVRPRLRAAALTVSALRVRRRRLLGQLTCAGLAEELAQRGLVRHAARRHLAVRMGVQEHRHGVEAGSFGRVRLGDLAHLLDRRLLLAHWHVLQRLPVLRQRAARAEERRGLLRSLRSLGSS
mmetsp:Transcript_56686/g.166420  ORF Transcript_56686/g.166420 Transcript_56686/m.166420 type:complete len:272 (-) Transcript_56686:498-1313(-)